MNEQDLRRFLSPNSPLVGGFDGFRNSRYSERSVFCSHFQRIFESSGQTTVGNIVSRDTFSTHLPRQLGFLTGVIRRIRETSFKLVLIQAVPDALKVFTDGLLENVRLALSKYGLHNAK
jgi:hypothetical protein